MPADKKRLDWADTARDEFLAGLGLIATDSLANAALVQSRIERSAELLRQHPQLGKPGAVRGTREHAIPNTPFTLIYVDHPTSILVLHCWHQRRKREG